MVTKESIKKRLDEISVLRRGWYEPFDCGREFKKEDLEWAFTLFENLDENVPLPYVYPTADGELSLEWELGAIQVADVWDSHYDVGLGIDLSAREGYSYIFEVRRDRLTKRFDFGEDEDIEETIDLKNECEWKDFCDKLVALSQRK